MAIYYDIPNKAEEARQVVRRAAAAHNTDEFKELLLIYLDGSSNLLKLVIDGQVGRDYSGHTVLHRARFDPAKPETWETQVTQLLGNIKSGQAAETASSESKAPFANRVEYLLIFADRNPDNPGVEWGPRTELLVRKVLDLIDVDGIDGLNVRFIFNPDFRPDYPVEQLGMRMLMQQPFLKLPITLSKVKFYPYRFEEAYGVAAVQFK